MEREEAEAVDLLALVEGRYPGWTGFDDPRFVEEERDYKRDAKKLAQSRLSEETLIKLWNREDFEAIIDRVKEVVRATNLLYLGTPSTGDLAVLERPELDDRAKAMQIIDLLYGEGSVGDRLERYREVAAVEDIRASWPLPTYLLMLLHPETEVFVKPTIVRWLLGNPLRIGKRTGESQGRYESTINEATYRHVQETYRWAFAALEKAGFPPRNMIDVQGFFWVAYQNRTGELDPQPPLPPPPPPPDSRVPTHADRPATEDELGRKPFAEVLATRIRQVRQTRTRSGEPDTFAVHLHGPWGAGKSSILHFLGKALQSGDERWVVVDFNAWRHQPTQPPWWPLIREVHGQAMAQLDDPAKRRLKWRWARWAFTSSWLPASLGILALGLVGVFWALWTGGEEGTFGNFQAPLALAATLLGLFGTIRTTQQSLLFGSSKAAQTYMDLRSDPLGKLSKLFKDLVASLGRPLAIFIDDLDRCDADYVVDLLEGIQTLFRDAPVVYVVAADREWIRASFETRHQTFLDNIGGPGRPLGHLFLEKMFQISTPVPRLSEATRLAYWQGLIKQGRGMGAEVKDEMVAAGREALEDAESPEEIQQRVEESKGTAEEAGVRIAAAQKLSSPEAQEETEHFLAPYALLLESNPRAMKRLVNAFGLQQSANVLSHVDVSLDALARWTILNQRWPTLADLLVKHPELVASLDGGDPIDAEDPRVPDRLRRLFTNEDVRRVVQDSEDHEGLTEELVRQMIGQAASTPARPSDGRAT